EQVVEVERALGTLERVTLVDPHPGQPTALGMQCLKLVGHGAFLLEQRLAGFQPGRARGDGWRVHGVFPATGRLQLTIQFAPNRSVSMPKRRAHSVSAIGIVTWPPSASALKTRSASPGSSTLSDTALPWMPGYGSGVGPHQSDPINTASPTSSRTWAIRLRAS